MVAIVGPLAGGLKMAGAVQLWQQKWSGGTISGNRTWSRTIQSRHNWSTPRIDTGWDQLQRVTAHGGVGRVASRCITRIFPVFACAVIFFHANTGTAGLRALGRERVTYV